MIAQESGPAALPDSRLAAEAAVKYVNTELGGAAGRPLQLETCITDGSPEQSSACANQLLEKHPVAFVGESELGTAGSVPIIEKAGVPLVGAAGITPELVLSNDAFAFGLDAVGDWSGWTKYLATDGKAKTINLINLDIPAAPGVREGGAVGGRGERRQGRQGRVAAAQRHRRHPRRWRPRPRATPT